MINAAMNAAFFFMDSLVDIFLPKGGNPLFNQSWPTIQVDLIHKYRFPDT
jgi:hypothetical protein